MKRAKQEGFYRIKNVKGKLYLCKIATYREGNKIKHRQIMHIGRIEPIIAKVCQKKR